MLRIFLTALVLTAMDCAGAQTTLQAFADRYKANSLIEPERILADPYTYSDQHYLVKLRFVRSVGPTAAVFAAASPTGASTTLLVTKVPTDVFNGGEEILAAVLISGYTETSTFPEVELVGFEMCKLASCSEF